MTRLNQEFISWFSLFFTFIIPNINRTKLQFIWTRQSTGKHKGQDKHRRTRREGDGGCSPLPVPKCFGQNAWNSGNKPREKLENKPKSLVNITFKTNYINRKSIGNIPNFVVQKSKFLIHLLSFPLANCYNHV